MLHAWKLLHLELHVHLRLDHRPYRHGLLRAARATERSSLAPQQVVVPFVLVGGDVPESRVLLTPAWDESGASFLPFLRV